MGITINIWNEIPELKNLKKYLSEKEILSLDSYEKCTYGSKEYANQLVNYEKTYYLNTDLENRNFILKQSFKLEKNEIKSFLYSDSFITFIKDMILFSITKYFDKKGAGHYEFYEKLGIHHRDYGFDSTQNRVKLFLTALERGSVPYVCFYKDFLKLQSICNKDMILFVSKNENFSRNSKLPIESIQKLKKELLGYVHANNLTI
ncbi:Uncharacterised protein [Campylobacter insulaenigrae]|uniref:hypothetical protein n=1 Tax=Campylobacter insulaenigrae TaxID=260714 RepID=UPI000F71E5C0|nr:hypothetical protein [Campylobacter insulaenigrae]MCR6590531.1 hypothetical protein [Campylobacter insulaenigrae]MCR6592068.1 hypothetical protein [Campylobacter insulaenigrae]VEJ53381.1 Uncharacterised protein [Campylobacter insulaenigrae]